jgi:hypothetical protein
VAWDEKKHAKQHFLLFLFAQRGPMQAFKQGFCADYQALS